MDEATKKAIDDNLAAKNELIASLVSDVVSLRKQVAERDKIIKQYEEIVEGKKQHGKMGV